MVSYLRQFSLILGLWVAVSHGDFSAPSARAYAQSSPPAQTAPKTATKPAAVASKAKKKARVTRRKRNHNSPRLKRMRQAFVGSATLRPMARQLLQDRTPAAYAGVEAYARRHAKEDAGALAWLVVGYSHAIDHDYARAVDPLNRARPLAGDLGDYVTYYLANSYLQTGRAAEAIATLDGFDKNFPDSFLTRDAHLIYATALLSSGRAQEAIAVLEKERLPTRSDLELVLGRGYAAAGQSAKAAIIFHNLYFTMPLSAEANQADGELRKLPAAAVAAPTTGERKIRAGLLLKGKRYGDAADEYQKILSESGAADRPAVQIAMADALRRADRTREAKQILAAIPNSTPEINAERMLALGEIERAANNDDGFLNTVDQLRQAAPGSPWLEQALLEAGNIYLLRRDYEHAIDSYRELQQRFPAGSHASYAHWKASWLTLRLGRNADAAKGFDQQIALYPSFSETPAALYWRARLAEEDNDLAMAGAYYQKLNSRFRNYYYGVLAQQRLTKIKLAVDPPHYAALDRVAPLNTGTKVAAEELPADDLRVQKAHLLENGALFDLAVRELRAAEQEDQGNWANAEIVRMYDEAGRYDIAIEVLKHAVPDYFAMDLASLPRSYWEALFPRPYWPDLKKFSESNNLDPYLVASLIRQESEFNPNAVSHANAVGLMQLLPKVGRGVAKQQKLKHFSTAQLFTPAVNLQLGTHYFRGMVDQYGAFEYALAAYNAGTNRVDDWRTIGKYRDPQEFAESIPFTETREYVQAILRNANVYRQLYGAP
ncbi:MAG TPA: transglycosylase SLT domain-containing protein [Terriglobales bacterium]|nr:transglycosylase SLT domain-containing protein [Terriglobales bacterium]